MLPEVLEAHDPAPPLPETVQVTLPLGAIAPTEPVTRAANTAEPPSVGVLVVDTTIDGIAGEIIVELDEVVVATGLYEESPAKVNVAE